MYQYPGQMGVGQPLMPSIYPSINSQAQQSPNFGPQPSQFVPQGVSQGNYPAQAQNNMRVRPVASYDEAKAVPTDFMGNILILTDLSHGMIYTKVLDPSTGSSVFKTYQVVPEQPPTAPEQVPTYDAKGEIEKLRGELNVLKKELGLSEGDKND